MTRPVTDPQNYSGDRAVLTTPLEDGPIGRKQTDLPRLRSLAKEFLVPLIEGHAPRKYNTASAVLGVVRATGGPQRFHRDIVFGAIHPDFLMWSAFTLLNMDTPAEPSTFVPGSVYGQPDPWTVVNMVERRGDFMIIHRNAQKMS